LPKIKIYLINIHWNKFIFSSRQHWHTFMVYATPKKKCRKKICKTFFEQNIKITRMYLRRKIIYINSVSLSVSVFVCRGPETHITFNKTVPPNSRAQKLFRTSNSYFLLLLLRSFSRNNCRRSLLLTFTFTSVSTQQLPSSMGKVFLGFGRCEEIWVRFFWAKGLGGS